MLFKRSRLSAILNYVMLGILPFFLYFMFFVMISKDVNTAFSLFIQGIISLHPAIILIIVIIYAFFIKRVFNILSKQGTYEINPDGIMVRDFIGDFFIDKNNIESFNFFYNTKTHALKYKLIENIDLKKRIPFSCVVITFKNEIPNYSEKRSNFFSKLLTNLGFDAKKVFLIDLIGTDSMLFANTIKETYPTISIMIHNKILENESDSDK